jgi:Cd2+/Zn2+-exporting ATPase
MERFSADTVLYLVYDEKYCGCLEIGDVIREESKQLLAELSELDVHTVMLTGDSPARAQKVANAIGMSAFNAGLLPHQKVECVEQLKARGSVLYVGDGINDAPVMTAADSAVSMGSLGSAAAVEASDFVLVSDSISAVPQLIKTARKTRRIVMQNVVFSIVMKAVFMVLGFFPWFMLWLAVFADVGVMLIAVLNSLRVRK